jgi:type II secretory pathway pseudopilin PulG
MPENSYPPPFNYQPQPPGYAPHEQPPAKPRKGLAVASLVIGLISLPTLGLLLVGAIVGLVLGIVALTKASNQPQFYGGKALAVGGIVASVLSLVMIPVVGVIGAIVVPMWSRSARDARATAAINALEAIHQAEIRFNSQNGRYGTLRELADAGLIRESYATTPVGGYLYYDSRPSTEAYCIRAEPEHKTRGVMYFSVTETGVVRYMQGEINPALCGEGTPVTDGVRRGHD